MPKLTIRDLFAVVTIVAVIVAWWVDRSRLAEKSARYDKYKDIIEAMVEAGAYSGPRFKLPNASIWRWIESREQPSSPD